MEKKFMVKDIVNVVLFCIPLFFFGLVSVFSSNKPMVSELENRPLKAAPAFSMQVLFNGSYFREYEEYFSDTFAFRDALVSAAFQIKELKGIPTEDRAVIMTGSANRWEEMEEYYQDEEQEGAGEGIQIARSKGDLPVASTEPAEPVEEETNASPEATSLPDGTAPIETTPEATLPAPVQPAENPVIQPKANPTENPTEKPTEKPSETPEAQPTPQPTLEPTPQSEAGNAPTEAPTPTPVLEFFSANVHANTQNNMARILLLNGRGMEVFEFSEEICKSYAEAVSNFQRVLGDSVKIYSMLVPSQIEYYNDEKYKDITYPQQDAMKFIWDHMDDRIVPVDVYDVLKQHTGEYIYFRTDHHWTALGAYYGYTAFMEIIGEDPVPLERYEISKVEGYLGSMYKPTQSKEMKANPDTIYIYMPFIQHTYAISGEKTVRNSVIDMRMATGYKYGVFISSVKPLGKISTSTKNGKKLMVIKDSFAHPFIPYLMMHYEEIYVVDARSYKNEDLIALINEEGIQEMLFLHYMQIITEYADVVDLMHKMLK